MKIAINRLDGGVSIMSIVESETTIQTHKFALFNFMGDIGDLTQRAEAMLAETGNADAGALPVDAKAALLQEMMRYVAALDFDTLTPEKRKAYFDAARAAVINEQVETWKLHSPGEYVSHHEIDDEVLPADRTFRDAWKLSNCRTKIEHDLPKAREITKVVLRERRASQFSELDAQFVRALEPGTDASKMAEILAEKQRLRDITKPVDKVKSLDGLRALL